MYFPGEDIFAPLSPAHLEHIHQQCKQLRDPEYQLELKQKYHAYELFTQQCVKAIKELNLTQFLSLLNDEYHGMPFWECIEAVCEVYSFAQQSNDQFILLHAWRSIVSAIFKAEAQAEYFPSVPDSEDIAFRSSCLCGGLTRALCDQWSVSAFQVLCDLGAAFGSDMETWDYAIHHQNQCIQYMPIIENEFGHLISDQHIIYSILELLSEQSCVANWKDKPVYNLTPTLESLFRLLIRYHVDHQSQSMHQWFPKLHRMLSRRIICTLFQSQFMPLDPAHNCWDHSKCDDLPTHQAVHYFLHKNLSIISSTLYDQKILK
jgi:hypothetical protein